MLYAMIIPFGIEGGFQLIAILFEFRGLIVTFVGLLPGTTKDIYSYLTHETKYPYTYQRLESC